MTSAFKFSCDLFKETADRQMLRADSFALSALNAVGSFAVIQCQHIIVIIIRIPVAECFLCIVIGEHIGNQDLFRAAAFFNAVAAGCAGNHIPGIEHIADLFQSFFFFCIQRLEIAHEGKVVFHLFQIGHF